MKCCYDPKAEAESNCIQCNVPLCSICKTDAELNEGLCKVCLRQKKFVRIYSFTRIAICSLGIGWVAVSFLLFDTSTGYGSVLTYGLLGLLAAFFINMVLLFVISRLLFINLEPHQKVFVALSRYSVSGNKAFFTQAMKAMKNVDEIFQYKDALFDQIVAILILQPYDLPPDWVQYLSESFKISETELLNGILEYGEDVFDENIFQHHYYQAIEPLVEVLKLTENYDRYNKLIDKIMARLDTVDLKAIKKSQTIQFEGMTPQQAQTQPRESPSVLRDKAFLTELKLIDTELEEFMMENNRTEDWEKLSSIIDLYQLPKVPKSTFEAARSMLSQPQQNIIGKDGIPGTLDDIREKPSKSKLCAECGIAFQKEQMASYVYNDISVNVCNSCLTNLEKEGHREPTLLAGIRKTNSENEGENS